MKVKDGYRIAINQIETAVYNPRKITADAIERLKGSIEVHSTAMEDWNEDDGFRLIDPIIVNKVNNRLVSGHQRTKALKELGQDWVHKADIRFVKISDEKHESALNVMLNNELAQGDWDMPKLKEIVDSLDDVEFDIEKALGFSEFDMKTMFSFEIPTWGEMEDVEGEYEELPNKGKEKVVIEIGDVTLVEEVVERVKEFCQQNWPDKDLVVDQED